MSEARVINGPHIRTQRTTRAVMMDVAISLVPVLLGAIYYFGIRALYLAGLSVAVCVLTEYIWQKLAKKPVTAGDFSAVVTGLLLVFNMPVTVPLWVLVAADVFSILLVKQMFGGLGNNFVNPALMGRLLVMVAWPQAVMQPGAMGETSKLLLLVGFGYLCYKGVVNAEAAFTYIATVTVLTFIFGPEGLFTGDILLNLFGGGLIMGGCYMLTDYVFVSRRGKLLYAATAGVITASIRIFSVYPEGICFGILTANCMAGMLSLLYKKHVYGIRKIKA